MTDPWDDYRLRRNLLLAAAGSYLPVVLGLGPVLAVWLENSLILLALGAGGLLLVTWADHRRHEFPCPGCGRLFAPSGSVVRAVVGNRRCPHCGLPKWADPGEYEEVGESSCPPDSSPP